MIRTLCIAAILIASVSAAAAAGVSLSAWNSSRAMRDIGAQLSFGRRALDTAGHEETVIFIEEQLAKTKASPIKGQQWVDTGGEDDGNSFMEFGIGHKNGSHHTLVNIIARFYPDNPRRIIIGTHYDSIVRAYNDKNHPDAPMPGANNSASGVALLLETARALTKLPPPPVGVDFVFFDGEEGPKSLGAGDPHWRALGSPYFTQHLEDFYPDDKPESAAIFDMVCSKDLALRQEPSSIEAAKEKVDTFWQLGRVNASGVFKEKPYPYKIEDDQDALNAAGIPSFLVIGFEYDPWFNTTQDTIDKCSAANLQAVGHTLLQYIYAQ